MGKATRQVPSGTAESFKRSAVFESRRKIPPAPPGANENSPVHFRGAPALRNTCRVMGKATRQVPSGTAESFKRSAVFESRRKIPPAPPGANENSPVHFRGAPALRNTCRVMGKGTRQVPSGTAESFKRSAVFESRRKIPPAPPGANENSPVHFRGALALRNTCRVRGKGTRQVPPGTAESFKRSAVFESCRKIPPAPPGANENSPVHFRGALALRNTCRVRGKGTKQVPPGTAESFRKAVLIQDRLPFILKTHFGMMSWLIRDVADGCRNL